MGDELVISSDSHVFETRDLWTQRIDSKYRGREPRLVRVGDADHIIVEADHKIAGIGNLVGAGNRFDAPEIISFEGTFEQVHRGGWEPEEHVRDMRIDGVSAEVLYPSLGLFFWLIQDSKLLSASFRAYNDWLAEFCNTNPDLLKGIAMVNLDDVDDGIKELNRAANMGLIGAMISERPVEERRYDGAEYDPFWAAAQDLNMPLSLHTATARGTGTIEATDTVRFASLRAMKVVLPAVSICDMIFAGVFERYPNLKVVVVEFELAWAAHLLNTMDYAYTERPEETFYRFKGGALPSDFFHNNIYLSFQEDAVGIRLRDVIGVDKMMWGSDYPHPESTFPRSREIIDNILAGVPQDEKAKIVGENVVRLYDFDLERII